MVFSIQYVFPYDFQVESCPENSHNVAGIHVHPATREGGEDTQGTRGAGGIRAGPDFDIDFDRVWGKP